jgi:hypothetical protein
MGWLRIICLLIASGGVAAGQNSAPAPQLEAAAPAPPAQRNALPEQLSAGPPAFPKTESPDAKAETSAPDLKLDRGTLKKLPGQDPVLSPVQN